MRVFAPLLCLLVLASCQDDPPPQLPEGAARYAPAGYELVWQDEFDAGPLPDTSKWTYQTGGRGWTAQELQYYTEADPDNVHVADGMMHITARREPMGNNEYSSARVVSKHRGETTYGYIEIRAKPARGSGLRSAFWLVGSNVLEVKWPRTGEIDLMQHYGRYSGTISAAVQTLDNYWSKNSQLGGSAQVTDAEDVFHVYACHWTEDALEFSVNGEVYWTYEAPENRTEANFPFDHPFYMLATLSVGGVRGPNQPIDLDAFPATFSIDYVRIFRKP